MTTTTETRATALIDKVELARQMRVSVHLVHKWVTEKKVPFLKIGTLVRFKLDEVLEHFEATAKREANNTTND